MNRIMGVDLGDARVGLAMSDDLGILAHPLRTVLVMRVKDVAAEVAGEVRARGVAEVVVGLPRNMDGSHGPAAEKARAFAEALRAAAGCPVHLWDERLTTVAATRALRESGKTAKEQRGIVDQVAAQMLLQNFLDARGLARGGAV